MANDKPKKSMSRRFLGNTGWIVGQQIYTMILQLLVGALSARFLGPDNYGAISYGASFVAFFTAVSQLGLNQVIITDLVQEKRDAGTIMGSALLLRVIASVLSVISVQILVTYMHPDDPLVQVVTGLQAIALIFTVYDLINSWFQTKLWSKYSSLATMLATTTVAGWRIFLLATRAPVTLFALSSSIQALVCLIIVGILFASKKNFRLSISREAMKDIFSRSKHLMFASIAITVYLQSDKLMLGNMVGKQAVGIYNSASTLAHTWIFIPVAIIDSARPIILAQKGRDEKRYRKLFRSLLLGIFLLGAFVALAISLMSPLIISVLYGQAYAAAVPILCLLSWAALFSSLGTARSIWLIAEDGYRYVRDFSVLGAILNVIINYVLIGWIGAPGAAIATLTTEISAVIIFPYLFRPTRGFTRLFGSSFLLLPEFKRIMLQIKELILHRGKASGGSSEN